MEVNNHEAKLSGDLNNACMNHEAADVSAEEPLAVENSSSKRSERESIIVTPSKLKSGPDFNREAAFLENAAASFTDIENSGPPLAPLAFDPAVVGRAERIDAAVYNPVTEDVLEVKNVIYERHPDGSPPERAYWIGRKLKKCIFGVVKSCTVLKSRNDMHDVQWEVTEEKAAVKIMSWQKIRDLHFEDPEKEVAVMQHVSRDGVHPHLLGAIDILKDDDYLLVFMPFCSSGDLFGFVCQAGRFPEEMARYWFKHILEALAHLQRVGLCHGDITLENILVDKYRTAVVIPSFGMYLRVPFAGDEGEVTDASGGHLRRLIKPLAHCGRNPIYASPELLEGRKAFDGFAVDLWSAAVVLFIMLVGLPPWEVALPEDPRFRMVVSGQLGRMLRAWNREVSEEATDLLQSMFMEDPRKRLSLIEVKNHPWVCGKTPTASSE